MRKYVIFAIALLISTPSFGTNTPPPPKPTPEVVGSSPWLAAAMASGIIAFVVKHYRATKK